MSNIQYLSPEKLVSPRERRYYGPLLIVSIIIWILIALSIVGLLYALGLALFIWFINGLFIAYIKSEAVKVSDTQLPQLYQSLVKSCQLLGMTSVPEMYVLQADGALNAFATRRSGRDFVVLFAEIVEAYGEDSPEVAFVIGHELGHVTRKHILKRLLTLPGSLVPLLGDAYSRACEATCDRYGMFCAKDSAGAIRAMMILSGGKEPGRKMVPEAFAEQHIRDRGFFVSWHELESGYPTLSQRVYNLRALARGEEPARCSRSPLAYIFATVFSRTVFILLIFAYIGVIISMSIAQSKAKKADEIKTSSQSSESSINEEDDDEEYDDEEYALESDSEVESSEMKQETIEDTEAEKTKAIVTE
jgi:Zn-dependent protease with chaperone function